MWHRGRCGTPGLACDACAGIVGRLTLLVPLLAVLIQKGRSIQAMDVLTCVQSPAIVQSHESEVRPGGIAFPLLPCGHSEILQQVLDVWWTR